MSVAAEATIGVIGGSGFEPTGITDFEEVHIDTPFGDPSDAYHVGEIDNVTVAFLARHGQHHQISPSELPNQANIYGFRKLGVARIVAVSAVGSLVEAIEPLHLVVPDQIIDRTFRQPKTFFGDGIVAHVPFADPFCPDLRQKLVTTATQHTHATVHDGGTYLCMEGPQFSTRAESLLHQQMGAAVVGMTASPEAKLAREAEVCYALLALSTDWDAWRPDEEGVTYSEIGETMTLNGGRARQILRNLIPLLDEPSDCNCSNALEHAIATPLSTVPKPAIAKLGPILSKYVGEL